jgi:FlaA1/EpsC-like NDP-sugar epimerase
VAFDDVKEKFGASLREWPNTMKVAAVALVDLVALACVVLLAYMLRISLIALPPSGFTAHYLVAPVLSIGALAAAGLYGASARNFSRTTEVRLVLSQLLVPPAWALVLLGLGTNGFARSVVFIYVILAILVLIAIRRIASWVLDDGAGAVPRRERIPVLIYGAGRQGVALAEALLRQGRYRPVAYVDTDYTLVGRSVNGLKVRAIERLNEIVLDLKPEEVLIAKPGLNRANRRILVDKLLDLGLTVKTVPGIEELVDGNIDLSGIRPIRVEDLLGRDPVPPDRQLMERAVKGRVVMVTGAGGSIGSELVRQVVPNGPAKIVLVEQSEYALFEIHREIENGLGPDGPKLMPILGDVLDRKMIAEIIKAQGVEVVFHAAAYKHVRMVQENAVAGIRNNVWGTLNVAEEAARLGVRLFVLISTDKAVRPTSIMGASKRVAEMAVQALAAQKSSKTIFAIVRFGNVLGSSGSVVPLFREQIEKGGPINVTHPDVTRYFMLIPEAAQLVIQAAAMATKGEVFVLDMGEPVKVMQLAETMIELAGMTVKSAANPDGDIEIAISGLKEGEKLYEELQIGRDVSMTTHSRIMRSNEFHLPLAKLELELESLGKYMSANQAPKAAETVFKLARLD